MLKVAAKRVGLSLDDYLARLADGFKWCHACPGWKPAERFGIDRSRTDGRSAVCQDCTHVPDPKRPPVPSFKGRRHTAEAREAMSEARRGNQRRTGKPCTPEQRARISAGTKEHTPRGADHPKFIDGRGHERANRGLSPEDIGWRLAVFKRDSFTCQDCGDRQGGNLNAHHIKHWATHPDLRHVLANGITLCLDCHDIRHFGRPRRR